MSSKMASGMLLGLRDWAPILLLRSCTRIVGCLVASLLLVLSASLAPGAAVSDLWIEQSIVKKESRYEAQPTVKIRFRLAGPAEVTVRIGPHRLRIEPSHDRDTLVLPEPFPVKVIHAGKLPAGAQEVVWDGLDERGQPVTEPQFGPEAAKELAGAARPIPPEKLYSRAPVHLLRITVQAGKEQLTGNFERLEGPVAAWPMIPTFVVDGLTLPGGDVVVVNQRDWHGYRLTPQLKPKVKFPSFDAAWNANVPVNPSRVRVDSKGNVYFQNRDGIFRYNPDGSDGSWAAKADYIGGLRLGMFIEPGLKEGQTRQLWIRGKRVTYTAAQCAELAKKPGFAHHWGGFAIDAEDNMYLAKGLPGPVEIQVFDSKGAYVRSIPVPPEVARNQYSLQDVLFGKDGALWVGAGDHYRINRKTGAVEQKLPQHLQPMVFDSEGNILGRDGGGVVRRLSPDGKPLPFTAPSPYLTTGPDPPKGGLDFRRPEKVKPEDAPGLARAIACIVPARNGEFYVVPSDGIWHEKGAWMPAHHMGRDGAEIEERLQLSLGQERPGNVFVGDEPASVNLYATSLMTEPAPLTAEWTLTDFDGQATRGQAAFTAAPRARQVFQVPLAVGPFGHYHLRGRVKHGKRTVLEFDTMLARIRPRKIEISVDSPFAMVWGTNYYLSGISGVKKERVGLGMPPQLFIDKGVLRPDLPELRHLRRGGLSGAKQESLRWGVRSPVLLTYGEPWLTSSWMAPIYDYDFWLREVVLRDVDTFGGPDLQHVQFWNEPDCFLYYEDGKFNREHYALLTKLVWSICKARDKEGRSIPDGDAGSPTLVGKTLPAFGAEPYCDAVPAHYPGAQNVTWDKMTLPNLPEGKVASVKDLLAIRDRIYPGKPLLVTEEGWWGHRGISEADGAAVISRVFIPEIAAGVDEVYWFAQSLAAADDPTFMLGVDNTPWPAYCAFATMTRLLEGAQYLGEVDLAAEGTFAYLFGRGNEIILPVWAAKGQPQMTLPCGADRVTVTDLMDRQREVKSADGAVTLQLSTHTQYVCFPRNAWAISIAKAELKRQLGALKLDSAAAIPGQITEASKTALADNAVMSRLYYLVKAAQQAAMAGEAPKVSADPAALAKAAHDAILGREGADGYLRQARVALGWTDRLARTSRRQGPGLSESLAWATQLAADATRALAAAEKPCYPGAVVNAYIGASGEIARIRQTKPVKNKPATRTDAQFRFQIDAKPGGKIDLELTVWNFYRHRISGKVAPRLPEGWSASEPGKDYSVLPGEFQRFLFTVTVPAEAKAGLYPLGGVTQFQGQTVAEIHTQRVKLP